MNKRTAIALLQNAAILLLSVSAAFLLMRVLSYETGRTLTLPGLFPASAPAAQETAYSADLSDMPAPFHLVVTGAYGRSSSLLGDASRETDETLRTLLQEALGSAETFSPLTETDFRGALSLPGIYVDYLAPLSGEVVAGQLGAAFRHTHSVRRLLLVDEGLDTAFLYLWDGTGEASRCKTAVSANALNAAIANYTADDSFFAFEGGEDYAALEPYTLLRRSTLAPQVISAALPARATDSEQLLSLLGFNVHTESRYRLSNGTEVIVESPRTLRLHPDGSLEYTGDEETAETLFQVYSAGSAPTEAEAVLAARNLGEALFSGEEFAQTRLCLIRSRRTGDGYELQFGYLADGLPVYFSDDAPAMTVTVSGSTITAFTLRWRQYTVTEATHTLLPARQAAAISTDYEQPFLLIGYADHGGSTLSPGWLAR